MSHKEPWVDALYLRLDVFQMLCRQMQKWGLNRHIIDYGENHIELAWLGDDGISRSLKFKFKVIPDLQPPTRIVSISGMACQAIGGGLTAWDYTIPGLAAGMTVEGVEHLANELYDEVARVGNEPVGH